MIRNLLTDSSTLFPELKGDVNLEDLNNYPLDFYTSSDHYVYLWRRPGLVMGARTSQSVEPGCIASGNLVTYTKT